MMALYSQQNMIKTTGIDHIFAFIVEFLPFSQILLIEKTQLNTIF